MNLDDDGPAKISLEEMRRIQATFANAPPPPVTPELEAAWAEMKARLPNTGDPWVDRVSMLGPWELHALGVAALYWNACESNLLTLLALVQGKEPEEIQLTQGARETSWQFKKAVACAKDAGLSAHAIGLLEAAQKAFDVCRENRNALIHAGLEQRRGEYGLRLTYRERKAPAGRSLPDDLRTIRRVADDISRLNSELCKLWSSMIGNRATAEVMLADERPISAPEPV